MLMSTQVFHSVSDFEDATLTFYVDEKNCYPVWTITIQQLQDKINLETNIVLIGVHRPVQVIHKDYGWITTLDPAMVYETEQEALARGWFLAGQQ